MLWVVDQNGRVLVGPRGPVPHDGTRRPISWSMAPKSARLVASPVERLTRNTDINFDMQQRRASWMMSWRYQCYGRAGDVFAGAWPALALSNGWSRVRTDWRRGFTTRVTPTSADELENWRKTLTSLPARWKKPADAPRLYGGYFHELRTPLAVLRGELEIFRMAFRQFTPESWLPRWCGSRYAYQTG